jgi:hypothetical protein
MWSIIATCWSPSGTESPPGARGVAEIVGQAKHEGRTIRWIDPANGKGRWLAGDDGSLEGLGRLDHYNAERLPPDQLGQAVKDQHDRLCQAAARAGLSASCLEPFVGQLLPHFVRADQLALRYQSRFLMAGVWVYRLSVLAVLAVAIQLLFFPHGTALIGAEILAIVGVLSLTTFSNRGKWHLRWIDYRFLAERLRTALFMRMGGVECVVPPPPAHLSHLRRPADWMTRVFERIWDSTRRERSADPEHWTRVRAFVRDAWIEDQRRYFESSWKRKELKNHAYERWGFRVFMATLVVACVHLAGGVLRLPESLHAYLPLLALSLPVVGAALAGTKAHHELSRTAAQYRNMARYLLYLSERIDRIDSEAAFQEFLAAAHEMFLRENQDWRVVYLLHKLDVA